MKLAFTCHRTTEVLGKKETYQLGDEMYPLVDGVEIVVKELRTLLRDCCCPRIRKVCNHCLAYGRFKMKRSFKLHINGNKGMFTCNNNEHPSIYINGGMSQDKLALDKEFVINVGTIIYMREPGGNRDDVKMEFHAIAIDDNDEEIVAETDGTMADDAAADKGIGIEATTIAVVVDAKVLGNNNSTPKSLMDNPLIATPIRSTPVQIGSVAFALPIEQHYQYSPGLFSVEATPSNQMAPDPPDSTTKKSTIQKDPTGKSPKFRLQSPAPVRSPPPVNQDKESWLQEDRMMNSSTNQMTDYSTTEKCKKE
ncbi:hypothetical protein FRACYDRAFT_235091 [Fragilariopsis cylindrus CCMP1102]|uniref:Uncharacterized protein n=1 Tax=Fragilariopsis cylindrus CCMP1102 TaxID=635003 RepID=A0A1E7FTP0_9STRA|nr:hypothetical protein FRACYDRAFT_235091 [Fragilariopsis cylindrus CCMP1102]|eukprot:OEU21465.1 hypothetical protein FRACYDRAFT_235091 [Fragilariopsis cylindrus CCMP1102]